MASEKGGKKEKNQNIQVFVRVRPINQRERDIKSLGVIDVQHNREVVVRQSNQSLHAKRFTFDRAFGPNATQVEVYHEVVSPLIEEVLAGYNCTVFAYGQTGTGKTHTMVGENSSTGSDTNWQNDPLAGIIPRSLSQLFDELRLTNTEYTVRVSYLELYNEELFDLLSTSEDNSKLRIYEDVTRKGSNIVNGLEEITVYNKNEVYKIMAQGQERKKVASTLMNAQSSRSHTVFTIVVHMKENSPEGEELVKIGKLNLVDLAGSENISKAGSDNPAKKERARECVNINQSLLTLGRVITALVERHPHIPYRESKLTRILQESLGGRAKTSIIATISPGHKDLEETMSTLDYANRAKNIQNKPEVNQKMTKKAILKEYSEEIDRLKRDLQAARDKNGIYLANDTYSELLMKQEEQKKEIQDLLLKKRAMEEERDKMENVFKDINQKLNQTDTELNSTRNKLQTTAERLANTSNMLQTTKMYYEEQKHLVSIHQETERKLSVQANELVNVCDLTTNHVACLHDSVDKRRSIESRNLALTHAYIDESGQQRHGLVKDVDSFTDKQTHQLSTSHSQFEHYTEGTILTLEQSMAVIDALTQKLVQDIAEMKSTKSKAQSTLSAEMDGHVSKVNSVYSGHSDNIRNVLESVSRSLEQRGHQATAVDVTGNVDKFVRQWYTGASDRVTSLQRSHRIFETKISDVESKRVEGVRRRNEARKSLITRREAEIYACIAELEQESKLIEERLSKKLEDVEKERKESEIRLNLWIEEEKRIFNERINKYIDSENKLLEERIQKMLHEVEYERRMFVERKLLRLNRQEKMLGENKEDFSMADEELQEGEDGRDLCLKEVAHYGKIFSEGTSAISIDMEAFSNNVVQVVEYNSGELKQLITQTVQLAQTDLNNTVSMVQEDSSRCSRETTNLLANVLGHTDSTMDTILQHVQTNSSKTIEDLSTLSTTTASLVDASKTHHSSQTSILEEAQHQVKRLQERLQDAVRRQAELEARYLQNEYSVYSPTGNTPARTEYRYPRALVNTSPHERLLSRFRAMHNTCQISECHIIDSDTDEPSGRQSPADSECSVTEGYDEQSQRSGFVAPRVPADTRTIVKSTSETDIYRREQGKENTERERSFSKKRSKLPAPQSHKKPLADCNGLSQ